MTRQLLAWPLVLMMCSRPGAQDPATHWVYEVEPADFSYSSPDAGEMGIDSVCSATATSVSCWMPDGTRNEELSKRVDARLSSSEFRTISLRFGHRNLFVIWHSRLKSNAFPVITLPATRNNSGSGLTSEWLNSMRTGGTEYASWLPADDGAKTIDLAVQVRVPLPDVDISPRGGTITLGDFKVNYGRLERPRLEPNPGYERPRNYSLPKDLYSQVYSASPDSTAANLMFKVNFLGRDGKELPMTGNGINGLYVRWPFHGHPPGESQGEWMFQGDTSAVRTIKLEPSYRRWITFKHLSLEPNR